MYNSYMITLILKSKGITAERSARRLENDDDPSIDYLQTALCMPKVKSDGVDSTTAVIKASNDLAGR
jgi:hypothetical protein